MYVLEDIIEFIKDQTAVKKVNANDDLLNDLGCSGDDHHEFIENYSRKFHVDINNYLWYFHTDEEGQNFGGMFFKPPNERVKHIPITPQILVEFANKGKWDMTYPTHTLPKRRYDILINRILIFLFLGFVIYLLSKKLIF
jgi:hypothetical protein